MHPESSHPDEPSHPLPGDESGAPERPFDLAVRAAFGEPAGSGIPDASTVAALRELIALLREAPMERPSNAMRARAERLLADRVDLRALVRRWLDAARQVAMDLVQPGLAGGADGMVPGLAGFRGAAAPIQTYRGLTTADGHRSDANEAWLDLQVEQLSTGVRLRGQVTCDGDGEAAVAHLIDAFTGEVVASEAIADDGTFTITADCREASLAIELEAGEAALMVRGLVLRT